MNTTPQVSTNTNSNAAPPSEDLARVPLTLPMIDAMLTDESTVTELQSTLQISKDEIEKLRAAAREGVLNIQDESDANAARSTVKSSNEAAAKIREVIGAAKGDSVIAFFKKRWSGSDGQALTPNAVPTDTRIVVNAPAFRMDIFRDGKLTKTYKVGIGYPEFPLPAGLRKATEIIFNPTWTPPDEPWVKGRFAPGKKVEAGSKDNPLGVIKIPIGLPSLIHGGKSAARLGTFASHGCVGITNAQIQDLAREISGLGGDPLSMQEISAYEKKNTETKNVKLGGPLTVDLRYETIVVTADGKLTIYRDVYERGTNTEENLRRVLDAAGVSLDSLPETDRRKILDGVKQMALDASGDAVDTSDAVTAGDEKAPAAQSDKVTKNIKGTRQVVFNIAALKGKGYPVPVNLKAA